MGHMIPVFQLCGISSVVHSLWTASCYSFSIINQFCCYTVLSRCFIILCVLMHSSISSRVGVFTSSLSSNTLLPILVSSWSFSFLSLYFSFSSSSVSMFSSSLKYSSPFLLLLFHRLCFCSHCFLVEILTLGYLLPYKIFFSHSDL
jgi:hypothetical protein